MVLTVVMTLFAYWTVCTIISNWKYEWLPYLAMGLIYPALYTLFYPLRASMLYSTMAANFRAKGISRTKYIMWIRWHEELKGLGDKLGKAINRKRHPKNIQLQ